MVAVSAPAAGPGRVGVARLEAGCRGGRCRRGWHRMARLERRGRRGGGGGEDEEEAQGQRGGARQRRGGGSGDNAEERRSRWWRRTEGKTEGEACLQRDEAKGRKGVCLCGTHLSAR
jgi:hypothetical protein